MTKHILLFLLFLFTITYSLNAQGLKDSICLCSNQMKLNSFFWKLDSLANNGYRMCAVDDLSKCKLDNITEEQLIGLLGKPSLIGNTNLGKEYIYYTYDYRKLIEVERKIKVVYYIAFYKLDNELFISKIYEGHFD